MVKLHQRRGTSVVADHQNMVGPLLSISSWYQCRHLLVRHASAERKKVMSNHIRNRASVQNSMLQHLSDKTHVSTSAFCTAASWWINQSQMSSDSNVASTGLCTANLPALSARCRSQDQITRPTGTVKVYPLVVTLWLSTNFRFIHSVHSLTMKWHFIQ